MTGDVILAFNGAPVSGVADMQRALDGIAPNSTVTATIWRNSAERSLAIQF
jgi:S1-C subfamily serine protease